MHKKYLPLTIFLTVLIFAFSFAGQDIFAKNEQEIIDWYIKDFQTDIVVNKDSSLLVTENIVADCGNLPNKHGIFRVLPTQSKTENEVFKTPIKLVSITDFDGNPYGYQVITDNYNHTITWKIGDANKTVNGVNNYRIVYRVENAIRFGNNNFDEFYWNVMGDFWDISTDNFSAKISFPPEVTSQNATVDYYTGFFGSKDKSLATYFWNPDNSLDVISVSDLQPGEGITVSIIFPKNIFTPYIPSFWEKYGDYFYNLFFLIPLGVFIFVFLKWRKYGKDPKMKKPIPPEFSIPDNITPIQMGMVLRHGAWSNNFVTAALINLAVKKFIVMEKIEEKVLFLKTTDYKLSKAENYKNISTLGDTEKVLLEKLFDGQDIVVLSSLKNEFYKKLPAIKSSAQKDIEGRGWMDKIGKKYLNKFAIAGFFFIFLTFFSIPVSFIILEIIEFSATKFIVSWGLSGFILLFFSFIMPKRTQAGVDLLFKIKGFELYMKQAENYRQQFYEKENIFDKFLPYAIIFGIAELWAQKMQLIYGEDYFKSYHPVWFVGSSMGNFDINSFNSQLNSISSAISSSTGSSSGSGGGGSSGGGGGGGGGGGW
jgi:uncharacterized membrane protein